MYRAQSRRSRARSRSDVVSYLETGVDERLFPLANGDLSKPMSAVFRPLSVMMNHPAKYRRAEDDLGRRSKRLAEDERGLVEPDRLAQTITEFIEWRAFSYWLRLTVETQGFVSGPTIAILQERCPGFLDYAAAYAKEHPGEPEFLWLRLLEWTDERLFHVSIAEGWRHALGYYATRDPRMDQFRAHWKQCRRAWKLQPPASLPSFETWRESALQHR